MDLARLVIFAAVVPYVFLSLFRFVTNPANSLSDAFTPQWLQRIRSRRITNRQRHEYRRARY
uniref:Uncharacterized protein n=1 Tax=Streptomyces sp. F12 TaxID=1436084 RepID=V9Z7X7_9ACTN|nr:hypothetical protein pFRL6_22 [Streptomyces sp. F12]